jgi:hypothetical protein
MWKLLKLSTHSVAMAERRGNAVLSESDPKQVIALY